MGFIKNYLKERKKDVQQYVIIKDTILYDFLINNNFIKEGESLPYFYNYK